jgi:hypothetical protein
VSSACADDARARTEFQRKSTEIVNSNICKFLAKPKSRSQVSAVRGSPLIRSVFMAIALLATALGLSRLTGARDGPATRVAVEAPAKDADSDLARIPFSLLLSAPAASVELDAGSLLRPELTGARVSGHLLMDPKNPVVELKVRWAQPLQAGEHRFAKLSLEIPKQPTFTQVFDADGDIDELVELPLPAEK